jgi:hypothetical protein
MIPELLSATQAAEKLQVAPKTLAVWRATRRYALRYVKVGRKIRYRLEDIAAFIEARTMPGDASQAHGGSVMSTRRGSR